MKQALEQLTTVGSVRVTRRDATGPYCGYEYTVNFEPWLGEDLEHALNYGDLPDIVVRVCVYIYVYVGCVKTGVDVVFLAVKNQIV